ncbi:MAG: glycosyltransferase [Lentisphaerae bacterium]|nr:glycosyltransferase [Lentisphaerota bacterium]
MKITVITICWNSAATLRRCMDSLLQQRRLPNEYILVDGGSSDGTLTMAEEARAAFAASGINFKILAQERREGEAGIPSAWNQGIAASSGELIGLLNSDDWYEEDALFEVEQALGQESAADMVIAPIHLRKQGGEICGAIHPKCLWLSEILMPIPHPGCFVRRRLYDRLGLYDTSYRIAADYDFIWRCRKADVPYLTLSLPLVNMVVGGTANSNRAVARKETLAIARRYSAFPLLAWLAYAARILFNR